jgi:hypothetical protein
LVDQSVVQTEQTSNRLTETFFVIKPGHNPADDLQNNRQIPSQESISLADIRCEQQLGGLLKSYSRQAA